MLYKYSLPLIGSDKLNEETGGIRVLCERGHPYRHYKDNPLFRRQFDDLHGLRVDYIKRDKGGISGAHVHRHGHLVDRRRP